MKRTNIYLEDRQTEALDRLAAEEGVSRAEIIRRVLDRALLGRDDSLAGDLAKIDLAFGAAIEIAPDAEFGRRPGEREAHLERMWQARA